MSKTRPMAIVATLVLWMPGEGFATHNVPKAGGVARGASRESLPAVRCAQRHLGTSAHPGLFPIVPGGACTFLPSGSGYFKLVTDPYGIDNAIATADDVDLRVKAVFNHRSGLLLK